MSINIKTKILFEIYGSEYMEAYRLDSMLKVFSDEKIRDFNRMVEQPKEHERIFHKLVKDGYLKNYDAYYEITSEGLLFYGQGGYTNQFLSTKRSQWSFIISIISVIIAIASFFFSINN